MNELYKKYRPTLLKHVVGQPQAVSMLKQMIKKDKIPHTLLFSGPSGCGKTTLARIIVRKLKCGKFDYTEMNNADLRGIDEVRKIRNRITQSPISGKVRVWLIDEAHKLTNDAQNAFLKMLEDTPSYVYFLLATTDPHKLIPTIRTRCTEISVRPLNEKNIAQLVKSVSELEKVKIPEDVIEKICDNCSGSARKALVYLNQIIDLENETEMMEAISKATGEVEAIKIARALFRQGVTWNEMRDILIECKEEDPEQMRYMILGYARSVLLSKNEKSWPKAFSVLFNFSDDFYTSKHAGLAMACYSVLNNKE